MMWLRLWEEQTEQTAGNIQRKKIKHRNSTQRKVRVYDWGERRGEIEEAQGRRDLASVHPPTLLAAVAQTVCSQQYMHLLVLFQEIITLCVNVCGCMCAFECQSSAKSGKQVATRWQTKYGEAM